MCKRVCASRFFGEAETKQNISPQRHLPTRVHSGPTRHSVQNPSPHLHTPHLHASSLCSTHRTRTAHAPPSHAPHVRHVGIGRRHGRRGTKHMDETHDPRSVLSSVTWLDCRRGTRPVDETHGRDACPPSHAPHVRHVGIGRPVLILVLLLLQPLLDRCAQPALHGLLLDVRHVSDTVLYK